MQFMYIIHSESEKHGTMFLRKVVEVRKADMNSPTLYIYMNMIKIMEGGGAVMS